MDVTLLVLKVTVLFLAALGVAHVFRRSPRHTHQMWTLLFAAVMALPLLPAMLPELAVPLWSRSTQAREVDDLASRSMAPAPRADGFAGTDAALRSPTASETPASVASVAAGLERLGPRIWLAVWLAGAISALAMLVLSLLRVHRLSISADEMDDPEWHTAAAEIAKRLGVSREVRLLLSDAVDVPMAGELWRPAIFLPSNAAGWDADCRDAVLAHELAHLAGHDPRRHVAARLMLAMYWFHPLAWIAARFDARACEDACDDAVVRRVGLRPSLYARVLLDLAGASSDRRAPLAALPIVGRSDLERRLLTILRSQTPPSPVRYPVPAMAALVLAALVASAQPGAHATSLAASVVVEPAADAITGGENPTPAMSACTSFPRELPGGAVTTELVGKNGYTRSIQKSFDGLRVCLLVEDVPGRRPAEPSAMLRAASRAVLETQGKGSVEQLELTKTAAGAVEYVWRVDGIVRSADARSETWRQHVLGVLDTTWRLLGAGGMDAVGHNRENELTRLRRAIDAVHRQSSVPTARLSAIESACDLSAPRVLEPVDATRGRTRLPRFLKETFDELELCVRIDAGNVFEAVRPSELMRTAGYAVLEARRGTRVQRFAVARDASGAIREGWHIDGVIQPIDAAAQLWRSRVVDVLDTSWKIWALQGREGLLRGEIAEVAGRLATAEIGVRDAERQTQALQAQIAALRVDERIAEWTEQRRGEVARLREALGGAGH